MKIIKLVLVQEQSFGQAQRLADRRADLYFLSSFTELAQEHEQVLLPLSSKLPCPLERCASRVVLGIFQ